MKRSSHQSVGIAFKRCCGTVRAKAGSARPRSKASLLCGKIFDETGDRLTPSHSKTKAGTRLRYYVSHRLIKNSGATNKDGWRLPAAELESKVAHVIAKHLKAPSFFGSLFPDATAAEIADAKLKIDGTVTGLLHGLNLSSASI